MTRRNEGWYLKVSLLDTAIRDISIEGLYGPKWERPEFVKTLSVENIYRLRVQARNSGLDQNKKNYKPRSFPVRAASNNKM
jgi:hypothetical protein